MRERKFPRSAVDRSKKWGFEPPFQRDTPDRRPGRLYADGDRTARHGCRPAGSRSRDEWASRPRWPSRTSPGAWRSAEQGAAPFGSREIGKFEYPRSGTAEIARTTFLVSHPLHPVHSKKALSAVQTASMKAYETGQSDVSDMSAPT